MPAAAPAVEAAAAEPVMMKTTAETEPDLQSWFAYRAETVTCSEELVLIPGRINPLRLAD